MQVPQKAPTFRPAAALLSEQANSQVDHVVPVICVRKGSRRSHLLHVSLVPDSWPLPAVVVPERGFSPEAAELCGQGRRKPAVYQGERTNAVREAS